MFKAKYLSIPLLCSTKGAYSEINVGDTIILVYKKEICAYGVADSPIGCAKGFDDNWQALSIDGKWILADPKVPLPYGVFWHTLVGNKQSIVKEIDGIWANDLILLITLNNNREKMPDTPFIQLHLQTITSYLDNGFLKIPAVQRGKVWNAVRAEILWDSLLRNIPIGTLSIRPVQDKENNDCHWDILDGQQRTNAIAMGFHNFPKNDSTDEKKKESLLWLDLGMQEAYTEQNDEKIKHSERKYFFKVTTAAHPWGYKLSDNETKNSILREWEKRCAVEKLNGNWENSHHKGSKPYPYELWPEDAIFPIPFDILCGYVEHPNNNLDYSNFLDYCVKNCSNYNWLLRYLKGDDRRCKDNYSFPSISESYWENIINAIKQLSNIVILAQNAKAIPDDEVGLYFKRMNKAGEVPSDEEIQYSLLKSKVPTLKNIDDSAKGRMQPSRLANIAMLTYLTLREGKCINSISISYINELSKDQKFIHFTSNKLSTLLAKIENWIVYSDSNYYGLPKINFSTIALQYPDLLRLLLYFADKEFKIENKNLIALVSIIILFENGIRISEAYEFYNNIQCSENWLLATRKWLSQAMRKNQIFIPPSPNVYEDIVQAVCTYDYNKVEMAWNNPSYIDSINATWDWKSNRGRFLLLYSTRHFLEDNFPCYDPVDATWCEENRPWDYDHIFPQSWLRSGRGILQGEYHKLVSGFLSSIGNIAPLAFSQNRGKGDNPPSVYMKEDNEKLFITYEDFFNENHSGKNGSVCLEMEKETAFTFARITSIRLWKLYNEFYNSLSIANFLDFKDINDKRYNIFNLMKNQDTSVQCFYALPNGSQHIISSYLDWLRPWIACGRTGKIVIQGDEYPCMVCIVSDGTVWEVGVRRHPDAVSLFNNTGKWWFDDFYNYFTNANEKDLLEKYYSILGNVTKHSITID